MIEGAFTLDAKQREGWEPSREVASATWSK